MINIIKSIHVLLICLFASNTYASQESNNRITFDLNVGEEGNINPEIHVPIYWGPDLFSEIYFKSTNELSQSSLDGFSDGKVGISIAEEALQLNILCMEQIRFPLELIISGYL